MSPSAKLLAGVELGGTKCVCILGTGPEDVRAVERLPTGEREETLRQIDAVLDRWRSQYGAPRALELPPHPFFLGTLFNGLNLTSRHSYCGSEPTSLSLKILVVNFRAINVTCSVLQT